MKLARALLALALAAAVFAGCAEDDGPSPGAAAGSWRRLPDPPLSPRDHAVVVGVDGRMLVVGGWEFLCPPNADCAAPEEPLRADGALYDPATDAWTAVAPAPFGLRRQEYAAVELDRSAYLVSGCRGGPTCGGRPRLLSYDPASDRWTDHGPVPGPEHHRLVAAVGGRLLVYAGSDEHGEVADLMYDPDRSVWTELPDDPLPRSFDRFIVPVGDRLVLTGSSLDSDTRAARLDLGSGAWTRLDDAPGSGYQLFATDLGPMLNGHFIDEAGWLLDVGTWTWSELPADGGERTHLGGVLDRYGATYDVPNSVGQLATTTRLLVFDTERGSYVTVPPPPGRSDVFDDSSTALGRDLFVVGGQRWTGEEGAEGELTRDAWVWTPPAG